MQRNIVVLVGISANESTTLVVFNSSKPCLSLQLATLKNKSHLSVALTSEIKKASEFLKLLRRLRDSNPRYPLEVYTLSRRAPSTTRTSLQFFAFALSYGGQEGCKFTVCYRSLNNFFAFSVVNSAISSTDKLQSEESLSAINLI